MVDLFITTINNGHRHDWRLGKRTTTKKNGHVHNINIRKRLALRSGTNHTHTLLFFKAKKKR